MPHQSRYGKNILARTGPAGAPDRGDSRRCAWSTNATQNRRHRRRYARAHQSGASADALCPLLADVVFHYGSAGGNTGLACLVAENRLRQCWLALILTSPFGQSRISTTIFLPLSVIGPLR